ncbi:MAG: ferric reductase-like transmembrane domain-containing protein [Leifsonia flava]
MTIQFERPSVPLDRAGQNPAPDAARQSRRRLARADLLVIAAWTSGPLAAALYLSEGAASNFSSLAETVTSLGILAGLIGTNFVLVMLVLAARIPLIDATIGHDRALATHKALGKPALYLLLGHATLLLTGYAMLEGINPIAEIGSLLATPDMPLAFVGLGLMILVVVTSLVAVRRKFPYELWFGIHLLSYAAVLAALPHQLSVGGVLAEGTVQRVYWIGLYVLALGSILTFRFIEPVVSSLRHAVRVDSVVWHSPDTASVHLSGRHLDRLQARGGQYFQWRFWSRGLWWHSHPISLSAVPDTASARITVRVLGAGTARMLTVRPGTRVSFEGPYGLFTDRARTAPKLAILASGIGVTSVRALLEQSQPAPGEATILLRYSAGGPMYLWDEMQELAARYGAQLYAMIGERPTHVESWMSATDVARGVTLRTVFPDLRSSDLYICGPTRWTDLAAAAARAEGLPDVQLHVERFDW